MIDRFLGAVQFLTIIPVRRRTAEPGQSALFFPVVGGALGVCGGAVLQGSLGYLPFTLVCLLVLAFWSLITGGLHEDGFADAADAFRAYRSPDKILEILKDSRIGAHGALALLFLMLVRWQALSAVAVPPIPALASALALGRAAIVMLMWITPPAGSGNALHFSGTLTTRVAVAVLVQAFLFAMWPGGRIASITIGGSMAIVFLARAYFTRRIGGVNGDCLGATEQIVETFCLIVSTCRPCTL